MEALEEKLWVDCARGSEKAREELIARYLPVAKGIAAGFFARRAVDDVEFGDYVQLAYVGLLEAVQRYRPVSGAQFSTFATYRIRGAILNGLPKMTEVGDRISYSKRVRKERTDSLVEGEDTSADSFASFVDLMVGLALVHQLDEIADEVAAEPTVANDPYASRAYDDMKQRLRAALDQLSERDRQIIGHHYFHFMAFDEIATAMNITKGRLSQLHKRALEHLREALTQQRVTEIL